MAVSLKTVFLLVLVLAAGGVTWAIRRAVLGRGGRVDFAGAGLALLGLVLVPGAFMLYFAAHGAWKEMVYCVITHNTPARAECGGRPGASRRLSWHVLAHPADGGALLAPAAARCARSRAGFAANLHPAGRGAFRAAAACALADGHAAGLHAVVPGALCRAAAAVAGVGAAPASRRCRGWRCRLLLAAPELAWLGRGHPPLRNETAESVAEIAAVLRLTRPGEYVMDAKGDCIYRPRPYYYALESFTRRLLMEKQLPDELVQSLIDTHTAVVLESPRMTPRAQEFIQANYRLIGRNLAVAGPRSAGGERRRGALSLSPSRRSMASSRRAGPVRGTLDGEPLTGARRLSAGPHEFRPEQPGEPATLLWSRALEKGFTPYPDPAPHSPR